MRLPPTTATSHRPFLFYGWYVVSVLMIGGVLGAGTTNLFMSIMLKPLTETFGWSRTEVSGAITAAVVAGGLASPVFGRLADRYGPRVLSVIGALVVAVAYFGLANLTELWQLYVLAVVGRAITTGVLGGVASVTAAANWFRRKRGRAIGLVTLSVPLGGAALALLGQSIIDTAGWRTVWWVLGAATLLLVVTPSAVVLRRRPEDLGLAPDGLPAPAEGPSGPKSGKERATGLARERSWTLREALRTPTLWLLAFAFLILNLATGAVAFHQVAYYTDIGLASAAAALALSVSALSAAFGNALWGSLLDRFSERALNVGAMLLAAVAMLVFLFVPTIAGIFVAAALYGVTARGSNSLLFGTLARYYGRSSYGAISGFANPFQAVGVGVGPLIASTVFDRTGSYHDAFWIFIIFYLTAALLLSLAKRPESPDSLTGRAA